MKKRKPPGKKKRTRKVTASSRLAKDVAWLNKKFRGAALDDFMDGIAKEIEKAAKKRP